jgi:hypothetical protein
LPWPSKLLAGRPLGADVLALPQLEAGDRLRRLGDERLLTGDEREVADGALEQRRLADGAADAHVDHDLLEARHLHHVGEPERLLELVAQLGVVALLEARALAGVGVGVDGGHARSPPHLRQIRILRPWSSNR